MTSHALCSWHHSHYNWNGIHRFCVITTTPLMVSYQLYIWHHTHLTYAILCTLHNVISTLYDFTPLQLSQYIHCFHDITHPIYDIKQMAIQTIYLPSDTLYLTLHPLYLCHQSQDIIYTTPTPSTISRTLCLWHPIQYACYHNNCFWLYTPLCITSHPVYLWHHIQYLRYNHTALMTTQWLYLTSHTPFLTPQPLYLCRQTNGTHICIAVALFQWHHNKCVSHHTWHTYDIIPNLHHITFTLYDINDHVTWHHKHITKTSDLLYMTSHPLFRTSHHFMYDIKSTVSDLA